MTPNNTVDFDSCVGRLTEILSYAIKSGAEDAARALVLRYGSVDNVFSASFAELEGVVGRSAAILLYNCAYVTGRRYTDLFVAGRTYSQKDVCNYLKALFIADSEEKIYLLTFDAGGRYITTHLISHGTVNTSEVLPRKFVESAVCDCASSVIIAHNHPGGNINPSGDDMRFTAMISNVFSVAGIELLYHVIVAGQSARVLTAGEVCNAILF